MKRYETPRRFWSSRQQVQDLRADRHVERGHRLVQHHELRRERERARDGDALALAAGELVRDRASAARSGRPTSVEQLRHAAPALPPRVEVGVDHERLRHDGATRIRGSSDAYGSWNTAWTARR